MAQNPLVVQHIDQHGWHLVLVKGDEQHAPFAYTIGLFQSYEHPEVVICGLNADLDVMKIILNNVGHVVREGGAYFANSRADDILEGYTCWFIPVPTPQYEQVVGQALRHYGDRGFPLLQLIWPSPSGFYPWDAELDSTNRARQELWGTTEGIAVEGHVHQFDLGQWPFDCPVNTAAFTTTQVLDNGAPIGLVSHDEDDGAWQILCGTTTDPSDLRLACLGCLFERDPSIGELADLPLGWQAFRRSSADRWERERSDNLG